MKMREGERRKYLLGGILGWQRLCEIRSYKIAPSAIFLLTAMKIPLLNALPGCSQLVFHNSNILGRNVNFLFDEFAGIFIWLNKIKLAAHDIPILQLIIINKQFVKDSLPPVVTAILKFKRISSFTG